MKLPLLFLDLREGPLENVEGINMIDENKNILLNVKIHNGSYDHAGELLDRINHWPSAIVELRRLAILPTQAHGIQNRVLHDGNRCRVCHGTWKLDRPEFHATTCPLKGTEP